MTLRRARRARDHHFLRFSGHESHWPIFLAILEFVHPGQWYQPVHLGAVGSSRQVARAVRGPNEWGERLNPFGGVAIPRRNPALGHP